MAPSKPSSRFRPNRIDHGPIDLSFAPNGDLYFSHGANGLWKIPAGTTNLVEWLSNADLPDGDPIYGVWATATHVLFSYNTTWRYAPSFPSSGTLTATWQGAQDTLQGVPDGNNLTFSVAMFLAPANTSYCTLVFNADLTVAAAGNQNGTVTLTTLDNRLALKHRTPQLSQGKHLEAERARVDYEGDLDIKLVDDAGDLDATPVLSLSSATRKQELLWLPGAGSSGVRVAGVRPALQFEGKTTNAAGVTGKLYGITLMGQRHGV